jgi:LysM repeat protein
VRPQDDWRRYVAPAAFLLAVTIAVVLVRAGLEHGGGSTKTAPTTTAVTAPPGRTRTTTVKVKTKNHKTRLRREVVWVVKAGDTFGVISAATGVPVRTIERLNPKASSTSLFIGQKIRIK